MKQTILGSGGVIGTPLAKELKNYTNQIRLVSRNPKKVNDTDELFPLDVANRSQIDEAIKGSEIVYVTIGFEYNLKVWKETWPPFMHEVINSCKRHDARLVFFDNVYMYSKSAIPFMTEESPILPPSEKGKIRQKIHEMIMNEVEKNSLNALIARSADFYGPDARTSVLMLTAAANLMKGKRAQAFGNVNKIHTYTYTPDAAKATAILGNTPDACNQVWHVPTTKEKLTAMDWINLISGEIGVAPRVQAVPKWMVQIIGLFMPIMREFPEMLYQYEQDYIFDSTKFEKRFGLTATPPKEGIKKSVAALKN